MHQRMGSRNDCNGSDIRTPTQRGSKKRPTIVLAHLDWIVMSKPTRRFRIVPSVVLQGMCVAVLPACGATRNSSPDSVGRDSPFGTPPVAPMVIPPSTSAGPVIVLAVAGFGPDPMAEVATPPTATAEPPPPPPAEQPEHPPPPSDAGLGPNGRDAAAIEPIEFDAGPIPTDPSPPSNDGDAGETDAGASDAGPPSLPVEETEIIVLAIHGFASGAKSVN